MNSQLGDICPVHSQIPMKKSQATEALRVAQEIDAIKAALKKRGYRTRKRPKQPVWTVYISADCQYILTYQPTPINSWVLYPQDDRPERHTLITLIQTVLTKRPAGIIGKIS